MTQCCNNCSKTSKTINNNSNVRINVKKLIFSALLLLSFATPTTICGSDLTLNGGRGGGSGNGDVAQEQFQEQQNAQQIPLVRLPSNTLLKYTAYKDVSILHFRVPWDARTALFTFKAYEETKGAFRKYFIFIFIL